MLTAVLCWAAWSSALGASTCHLGEPPLFETSETEYDPAPVRLAGNPPVFFSVATASREEVRSFYNTVVLASEGADPGWTGDVATCTPGSTTSAFKDWVALRINWMRALAGVPAWITLDGTFSRKAQQMALMISANNAASHSPPAGWKCYSAEGAEAAGKSNLAIGSYGPESILRYIEDFGSGNSAVGHRRWLLMPQTKLMGTGDTPPTAAGPPPNVLWIMDGTLGQTRPATREPYVSWPPTGYVPYPVVFARWSFSYAKANFNSATVAMSSNGVPVAVTVEPVQTGFGENTLVWRPNGVDVSQPFSWPKPTTDVRYAVSIKNVVINSASRDFDYTVTVFDPQTSGADTILPALTGPESPVAGRANAYRFTPVPIATGHQWIATRRTAWTLVEQAEVDSGDFVARTSPGYSYRAVGEGVGGSAAWHLAHTVPKDQWLQYRRIILPGPNTALQFKSRLTWASTVQQALVQVSLDDGHSWRNVYSESGSGGAGQMSFQDRTVPLGAFADRPLLVRFLYHFTVGTYFPQPDAGWFIDDLTVTQGEELIPAVSGEVPVGTSLDFTPTDSGPWALVVRAKVYGDYWLEWGLAKRVTASPAEPVLTLTGSPSISGNQVQLFFTVANKRPGMTFRLDWSAALPGQWNRDSAAVLREVEPGTKYRFETSKSGGSSRFYRVWGE